MTVLVICDRTDEITASQGFPVCWCGGPTREVNIHLRNGRTIVVLVDSKILCGHE